MNADERRWKSKIIPLYLRASRSICGLIYLNTPAFMLKLTVLADPLTPPRPEFLLDAMLFSG